VTFAIVATKPWETVTEVRSQSGLTFSTKLYQQIELLWASGFNCFIKDRPDKPHYRPRPAVSLPISLSRRASNLKTKDIEI